ncbi:MAG: thiamine pyrophosphate-dependent dehydrogenase E1 component subunit alpha [Gemmataceae bacterium]
MSRDSIDADNDEVGLLIPEVASGHESLPVDRCLQIYRLMVRTRTLEERMIKMSKSGQGYFWVGGPGEEAFNTCLGLQVKKGQGPHYDYLHLHYRSAATLVAMGMPLIEPIRQMAMTATDSHSLGRNFISHYSKRAWNVLPVTSVIEIQYTMAPGTALMQKRVSSDSLSIVTGGDAGTAEGDFASCMVWSSRPGNELPVLMVVANNGWGISTAACTQHGELNIVDRGRPFGIPGEVVDGNDPIACWHAIARAMAYVRSERRPYLLEAHVSRLFGHSSSSGALRVKNEPDCVALFERRLRDAGALDPAMAEQVREEALAEVDAAVAQALTEPQPTPADVHRFTYAPSGVDAVYPADYTGLPQ